LQQAKQLYFTSNIEDINFCDVYIITVPTPIDIYKKPNFKYLNDATSMLGKILKPQDIVIYESTVYPGAIEEIVVPSLEQSSNLKFNQDFFIGYSPERVNPGDKTKTLTQIKKITSGSTPETSEVVKALYEPE
jgi:UDP-N-acetyl-D-galactosamine dehydrogenase